MSKRRKNRGRAKSSSSSPPLPCRNRQSATEACNDDDDEQVVETKGAGSFLKRALSVLKDWPRRRDTEMLTSWESEAKNELLKSYREELSKSCDGSTLTEIGNVTLRWKRKWGAFSKFTRHDHKIDISTSLCSGMQGFQPVCAESASKLLSSLSNRSPMIFLPVDSSFVSFRHLREGVKFVVSDPNPDLTALLDANDYVLFAGGFDVMTAACEAGVLFKEKDLVLGVMLRDAYSFFMGDLSLNLFTEQWDVSKDWDETVSTPEESFKLSILYVVSRALWLRAQPEIRSFPPKTREVFIFYEAMNHNRTLTIIKWKTHVLTDCPMKVAFRLFAESLGEAESAFKFHPCREIKKMYCNKKSFNGNLPIGSGTKPVTFHAQLKDPHIDDSLNTSFFLGEEEEEEFLVRRLRLTRLAVTHKTPKSRRLCSCAPKSFRVPFLVQQEASLDDVVTAFEESLEDYLDTSFVKGSYSWFCRVDDKTLLKVPEAVAVSPRDVADFVGVDPVQMELLLTVDSPESKIRKALPFDRAPIDSKVFKAGKYLTVWKGCISDVSTTTTCSAWISMSTAISPAEQKVILEKFELWSSELDLYPDDGRFNFDEDIDLSADNSFELLVTFCPVWEPQDVEDRAEDILAKLKDQRIARAFFFFVSRFRSRNLPDYGMLHFDQESDSFKMRLEKKFTRNIGELFRALGPSLERPQIGDNDLAGAETYARGVMTFRCNTAPCFAFLRSKDDFEEDIFPATYSKWQSSHVWLVVEEEAVVKAIGSSVHYASPESCCIVDVAGPMAEFLTQPKMAGVFLLVLAGTAEEVGDLMRNNNHERLAKTMLLVKVVGGRTPVIAVRMKRRGKDRLARLICKDGSPSVAESISNQSREEEADINKLFKSPDLSLKWALNLERAKALLVTASPPSTRTRSDAVKIAAKGKQRDTPPVNKKDAEATAAVMKKKRLAAAAFATDTEMSKDDALAKLEVLRERLSATYLTPERSEEVDALVAEGGAAALEGVAASALALKACAFCRRQAFEMRVCSGCRVTHYCGQKCQKTDWKRHKPDCRETHKSRMQDLVKML